MAMTTEQFGKSVVAAGLLTVDDLKALWSDTTLKDRPKDGPSLAKVLIERGLLNEFQAEELLADHEPEVVIADRGYDKRALVERIESRGAQAVIPTQKSRAVQRVVDPHWYRERNLCERFWSKVEQYRRVATRYEKKAANFLAFVKVAAIMVMLK